MKAIETIETNAVLKAPPGAKNVYDLPVARLVFEDGVKAIESCWELSDEEIQIITSTKRVYLVVLGVTHPPLSLEIASSAFNSTD